MKQILSKVLLLTLGLFLCLQAIGFSQNVNFLRQVVLPQTQSGTISPNPAFDLEVNRLSKNNAMPSIRNTASPENHYKYNKSILDKNFDFQLASPSKGKISLSFVNYQNVPVAIRVYDLIGNLILEENVYDKGAINKEYDFSFSKTDLFVVEVGTAKYNKTKSVIAG